MKAVLLTMLIVSTLTATAAAVDKASTAERELLCLSVDEMLSASEADVGFDLSACRKNKSVTSKLLQEGVRSVSGKVKFNSPNHSFSLRCSLAYEVTPTTSNIVTSVECK